ncbi:MAG: circadian clock protein KaiC [Mycobacteriales bacterium]
MNGAGSARRAGLLHLGRDGHESGASVPKLATGIPGFDHVAMGGIPRGRATVLVGRAGSAKTVFAGHFLAEGVRAGQAGVFVTFEEPAPDLRTNLGTLGFDVPAWEAAGQWRFVDASPVLRPSGEVAPYNLETLAAQVGHAVDGTGAERLVLDGLTVMLSLAEDPVVVRQRLRSLIRTLRGMGLTIVLTVEAPDDRDGTMSRYGIEEFVADTVVLLRNVREGTFRRRTVEVLKMRGAMHHKGAVACTIVPGRGLVVLPVREPEQATLLDERLSTGSSEFDAMTGGGLFQSSSTLVSGPTGTGKTLLATAFLDAGAALGERVVLFAYEETREQILRNARGWGHDLERHEQAGHLLIVPLYPEVASLDDHLVEIRAVVDRFSPSRIAVDSLSALERLGSPESYREFVIGLTSYAKETGVTTLVTSSAADLLGGGRSATDSYVSGVIDTIVLLRYVEVDGSIRRVLTALKMRGSRHDSAVREFTIDSTGLVVGERFTDGAGGSGGSGVLGRTPGAY